MRFIAALFVAVGYCTTPATATTVIPVTFDEMVAAADVIFVGEVVDVRPFTVTTPDGVLIKTRVTFSVAETLWGPKSLVETFDFLGGEWGDVRIGVADMPTFARGDRRVVFARREQNTVSPIVGFSQGLLQIRRDSAGVDRLFTAAGLALDTPERLGTTPTAPPAARPAAMPLAAFRDRVSYRLREARTR
jgi:hypothetical protein